MREATLLSYKRIPLFLFLLFLPLFTFAWPADAAEPKVAAASVLMVDTSTGQVLYEKNADQQRAMASTTKMVTALLVLEAGNLDTLVAVSPRADVEGGSSIGLYPGEIISRKELLWGLLLKSGNDAAIALAESVSGSVEEFVSDMNGYADGVGADSTHFTNPNGMPDPDHYSTARDLAIFAKGSMKHPEFARIVGTEKHTSPATNKFEAREYESHNRLIANYRFATGIKTGFTNAAQHCLVSSATKDGIDLVLVVLGGSSPQSVADESEGLLEYGFSQYSSQELVTKGEEIGIVNLEGIEESLPLVSGVSLEASVAEGSHLRRIIAYTGDLVPPVTAGQTMGEVIIMSGDKRVGAVPLVAKYEVEAKSFFSRVAAVPVQLITGLISWIGSIF